MSSPTESPSEWRPDQVILQCSPWCFTVKLFWLEYCLQQGGTVRRDVGGRLYAMVCISSRVKEAVLGGTEPADGRAKWYYYSKYGLVFGSGYG
jgi:hypothetical protein